MPRIGRAAAVALAGAVATLWAASAAFGAGDGAAYDAAGAYTRLAADLQAMLPQARRLMLGSRDPRGESCVAVIPREDGIALPQDPAGGPGTLLSWVYSQPDAFGPLPAMFQWHQQTLRQELLRLRDRARAMRPEAEALAARAERLATAAAGWEAWPGGIRPAHVRPDGSWFTYTLGILEIAADRQDLATFRRWSDELASATFALADLVRWVEFLAENHVATIDFQAQCIPSFEPARLDPKAPGPHIANIPGGQALANVQNYLEAERQAEYLFRVPEEWFGLSLEGQKVLKGEEAVEAVPEAAWLPPDVRDTFVELREHLGEVNRRAWDRAAHEPFERSYLANMLFRARKADVVERVGTVLARYDARTAKGTVGELMDVIFYRGGDPSGGLSWGDRYDPRLMEAAGKLAGSDAEVLAAARRSVYAFIGGPDNYSPRMTLRSSLDTRKLDCINATDMIGSLYRNAGCTGFYNVHWTTGAVAHTVAAAGVMEGGKPAIVLADGLARPDGTVERWPDAYLTGHPWPDAYNGPRPPVHAVELYGRGLDNYIWLEGYVIRGPKAGTLVEGTAPYLAGHEKPRVARLTAPAGGAG